MFNKCSICSVCKLLSGCILRAFNPVNEAFFRLLPVLCMNESSELEPTLARDCTIALACLSQTLLPEKSIDVYLDHVEEVAQKSTSWKAKGVALDMLGVGYTFHLYFGFP